MHTKILDLFTLMYDWLMKPKMSWEIWQQVLLQVLVDKMYLTRHVARSSCHEADTR